MFFVPLVVVVVLSSDSLAVNRLNENQVRSSLTMILTVSLSLQVSLGQTKYRELSQSSAQPRYGPCWVAALSQLETECEQLTEESHSR